MQLLVLAAFAPVACAGYMRQPQAGIPNIQAGMFEHLNLPTSQNQFG
jgi:hypothetical protein